MSNESGGFFGSDSAEVDSKEHLESAPLRSDVLIMNGDKRPKKYGWAPGNYYCLCYRCKREFIGDKRSCMCADCAYGHQDGAQSSGQ